MAAPGATHRKIHRGPTDPSTLCQSLDLFSALQLSPKDQLRKQCITKQAFTERLLPFALKPTHKVVTACQRLSNTRHYPREVLNGGELN